MSFPAGPPFNPTVSKVPILDASSGNPNAYNDPNSAASMARKLQAMKDQAQADTLYDLPPTKVEGFSELRNEVYSPWILRSKACSKEGFKMNLNPARYSPPESKLGLLLVLFGGLAALIYSISKKYKK